MLTNPSSHLLRSCHKNRRPACQNAKNLLRWEKALCICDIRRHQWHGVCPTRTLSLLLEEKVPNFVRRMRWKGRGFLQRHQLCAVYPTTPHLSRRTAAPPPLTQGRHRQKAMAVSHTRRAFPLGHFGMGCPPASKNRRQPIWLPPVFRACGHFFGTSHSGISSSLMTASTCSNVASSSGVNRSWMRAITVSM